ncbi:hypothetical protein [Amycolatopsis sp. NPDC059021]|uniref:hypothetical protein n=1 Tax=Amycolatopsis sp. NPDC059021 TaxID=3346704 RepID=UPI00366DAF65
MTIMTSTISAATITCDQWRLQTAGSTEVLDLRVATATHPGDQAVNCDQVAVEYYATGGTVAIALLDGKGADPATAHKMHVCASAGAAIGARHGALNGLATAGAIVADPGREFVDCDGVGALAVVRPGSPRALVHVGRALRARTPRAAGSRGRRPGCHRGQDHRDGSVSTAVLIRAQRPRETSTRAAGPSVRRSGPTIGQSRAGRCFGPGQTIDKSLDNPLIFGRSRRHWLPQPLVHAIRAAPAVASTSALPGTDEGDRFPSTGQQHRDVQRSDTRVHSHKH